MSPSPRTITAEILALVEQSTETLDPGSVTTGVGQEKKSSTSSHQVRQKGEGWGAVPRPCPVSDLTPWAVGTIICLTIPPTPLDDAPQAHDDAHQGGYFFPVLAEGCAVKEQTR